MKYKELMSESSKDCLPICKNAVYFCLLEFK